MTHVLGDIAFASDFHLGPSVDTYPGHIQHFYVERESGTKLKALVIGVVRKVFDTGDGVKIAVIVPPDGNSPVIRTMYLEQAAVLTEVLKKEAEETHRIIFNRQQWSQGSGALDTDCIFVRILPRTMISEQDFSTEPAMSPYEKVAEEIPLVVSKHGPLEEGSLVVCCVYMFRLDYPLLEGCVDPVYSRAYVLDTITCCRFMRSDINLAVDSYEHIV
ncbi:hypothetical protein B0H11DRAFT_2228314 [Mycena galericulata]|nr:hypothetical protein B0H11DRAFT_2228314 [Mycena galericulata]